MVGLPFESLKSDAGFELSEITFEGISNNDQVQYWDGTKLNVLTYANRKAGLGWYENFTTLTSKKFAPGEAFWLKSKAPVKVVVAGKVAPVTAKLTTSDNGFTLVGSLVPVAYNVNDLTFEGISSNDQIQYWNGKKLVVLTYANRKAGPGWYENFTTLSSKTFNPMEGFWLKTKKATTVSFPSITK